MNYKNEIVYFGGDTETRFYETRSMAYADLQHLISTSKVNQIYLKRGNKLVDAYIYPYNKNTQYV